MASRYVGVEVSNSAVRIAEIAVGGGQPELVHFGMVSLPPRAVVDGAILDVAAVAQALSRCMKECGVNPSAKVYVGVAGLRAITREIEMPNIPDSELDAAVHLQALDVIPFPPDKTLLSARPFDTFTSADGTTMRRVLIAAAHRDLVDPLLAALEAANLNPISVDLTSSALVRSLAHPSTSPRGPEAIVSVGAGLTTVVIHEAGVPHFVRTIASGSDAVTAAIAATLDIPIGDAEATKRNLDKPGPHIRVAAGAASDATGPLINEIKNSIDYYSTLPGRGDVQQVVVTGGGSRLVGFTDRLAQQFRIPVVPGSCLSRVDCSGLQMTPEDIGRYDPLAAVVIGLALPDPVAGAKPLNLLPPEIARRAKQRRAERIFIGVCVVLVLMFIGLGVWQFLKVNSAEGTVSTLQASQVHETQVAASLDKYAQAQHEVLADEHLGEPLVATETNWPLVLSQLQKFTPAGLIVTSFSGTTDVPPSVTTAIGPQHLTAAPQSGQRPTNQNAISVVSLSVIGKNYSTVKTWINAFDNTAKVPFLLYAFSGFTIDGKSANDPVVFTTQMAVTGGIQTPRYPLFEISQVNTHS
jgi:type IV pilus assembly protein PilM